MYIYKMLKGNDNEPKLVKGNMYRAIDQVLKRMPEYTADVLREKYGLDTGKGKSNKTIANSFRRKYGEVHGYTWNTARVAKEIQEGLSEIGCN